MNFPETAKLATEAYEASGAKTRNEFLALLHGAMALRTFRRFLSGETEAPPMTVLVLRGIRDGWRPTE